MLAIVLQEKGGDPRRLVFDKPEVTVGRVQGNDIVLPKGNVSKRHARIVVKDGKFIVVDLKSTNGTYVNGRKITSPLVVRGADKIYIGDFIICVDEGGAEAGVQAEGWDAQPQQPEYTPPVEPEEDFGNDGSAVPGPPAVEAAPPPVAPPPVAPSPVAPSPVGPPVRLPGGLGVPSGLGLPPRPASASTGTSPAAPAPFPRAESLAMADSKMPETPYMTASPATSPAAGRLPLPKLERPLPSIGAPVPSPSVSMPAPAPAASPSEQFAPPTVASSAPAATAAARGRASIPAPLATSAAPSGAPAAVDVGQVLAGPAPASRRRLQGRPRGVVVPVPSADQRKRQVAQHRAVERVVTELAIESLTPAQLADDAMWQRTERALVDVLEGNDEVGPEERAAIARDALNECLGWGLLEDYLGDERIEAVVVDHFERLLLCREGAWSPAGKIFSSEDALRRVVERIATSFGASTEQGCVDVVMRGGVRLTAVLPPLAQAVSIQLRKPKHGKETLATLEAQSACNAAMVSALRAVVAARRNVVVVGLPGGGREALVQALVQEMPPGERVVCIEDYQELAATRPEQLLFERRGSDANMVLRAALALRPNRLVVADPARDAESLLAACSGHVDGAVVVLGAASAVSALERFAAHVAAGRSCDAVALQQLMGEAFDVVVTCTVNGQGRLKIAEIFEHRVVQGQRQLYRQFHWEPDSDRFVSDGN